MHQPLVVERACVWLLLLCFALPAASQESQGQSAPASQPASKPASKAASKLDRGLLQASDSVAVFVRMRDQLFAGGGDYERFCSEQPATTRRLELRKQILTTLQAKANRSFTAVEQRVAQLIEKGQLRGLRRYWIVNGFACAATPEGCAGLAELAEVGFVYRQRYGAQHQVEAVAERGANRKLAMLYRSMLDRSRSDRDEPFDPAGMQVPWNLKAVAADRAWSEHGATGKGVVVAVLDDGLMTVPALLPALWRNREEVLNGKDDDGNGYVDDVFGYDFRRNRPYPVTPSGHRHGTMCAGIVAARPTSGEESIASGVAPRASIMPLAGSGQLRAYEYALMNGADVLSMSYTFEPKRMGAYRGLFRMAHEHLAAAGIVSVGGAGNYAQNRPAGEQIGSPKDVPCVIAASGVAKDGKVPAFSSRGPVSWRGIRYYGGTGADEASGANGANRAIGAAPCKPDVTACNADIPVWTRREVWTGRRANRLRNVLREGDSGYLLATGPRGNSFAGPHAAGVLALMLEANPELPVWHLKRLLETTCTDMGAPGRDTTHGAGMIQADKAVAAARAFAFE